MNKNSASQFVRRGRNRLSMMNWSHITRCAPPVAMTAPPICMQHREQERTR